MDEIIDRSAIFEERNRKRASQGARLANYFLDGLGFYFLIFLLAFILGAMRLEAAVSEENSGVFMLFVFFLYIMYFSVFEYYFGKTPGKFIAKTRVVTNAGYHPSFSNIVGRTLCRFIPFDALSFLFAETGWHDSISKTLVVKDIKEVY